MANEEAVLSPALVDPFGLRYIANYAFIWAMAGDNVDYTDVDPVADGDTAVSSIFRAFSLAGKPRRRHRRQYRASGRVWPSPIARAGGAVVGIGRSDDGRDGEAGRRAKA